MARRRRSRFQGDAFPGADFMALILFKVGETSFSALALRGWKRVPYRAARSTFVASSRTDAGRSNRNAARVLRPVVGSWVRA